jgi:hypothetical protein
MNFLRKHIVFRYFWAFMAFHILNCSIDTPDAQPDNISEDLSFNDIESISELVLEQIFGFDNAISEHDEHDTQDGYSFEIAKILLYFHSTETLLQSQILVFSLAETSNTGFRVRSFAQIFIEINSPPPQLA